MASGTTILAVFFHGLEARATKFLTVPRFPSLSLRVTMYAPVLSGLFLNFIGNVLPHDFATNCWFLSGATASGKTGVGIELARRIDAEIISMDSMALYRHMDIGTAKPTLAQRRAVSHHLIDVIEPREEYSLAQYIKAAKRCAEEIQARARRVLFVGGTPLYLKGLLRGIFEGPPADQQLRRHLADEALRYAAPWLHNRLAEIDPLAAERLHPNDTRRLIRAIEVFEKTGRPISQWQKQFDTGLPAQSCRVFVLDWPRHEIYARIDRRVDEMFAAGLLEEVCRLMADPQPPGKTAGQAVGYREVIEHLQGVRDLPNTIELIKTHTHRFARRQCTWFRGLGECRFIPLSDESDPLQTARLIEQQ